MTTAAVQPAGQPKPRAGEGLLHPVVIGAGVAALAAFVAYALVWVLKQHQFSSKHVEDWGHAYVIPGVSAILLWKRRGAILAERLGVFAPGVGPLLFGLVGYVFFVLQVPNHMLQGFCLIVALYGLVLTALGPGVARQAFLPIAFLGFGITISEAVMLELTFPLQLLASKGAWVLLSLVFAPFGYGVEIDGNTLSIVDEAGKLVAPMNVAEACSGMRMLIAFFALAAAVALLSCRQWWQRVALVLLAAPVALFMNIVRVSVLGLLMLIDPELASGEAHMLIGTVLLVPSLGLFLAVRWALRKVTPDAEAAA